MHRHANKKQDPMRCHLFLWFVLFGEGGEGPGTSSGAWGAGADQAAELPFPVEWVEMRHPGSQSGGAAREAPPVVTSSSSSESCTNWDSWSPASPHQLASKAPLLGLLDAQRCID